jgi:CheY-like chemotaxis protein
MLIEEWFEEKNINDFKIDSVLNGNDALKKVTSTNYNIIFLDLMMPIMDGFEVLENIRKKEINFLSKIIVTSAIIDNKENKTKAKELKANAFIVKPLSFETINIMLNKYIKNVNVNTNHNNTYTYFDNENINTDDKLTAKEFLKEYPSNILDIDDIEELVHQTNNLEHKINYSIDLNESIVEFEDILEKSRIMLLSFTEFDNLAICLNNIKNIVTKVKIAEIDNENKISQQLLNVAETLSNWFERLFILKDLDNVFEINQSITNSLTTLQKLTTIKGK